MTSTSKRGIDVLKDSLINKSTGFSESEKQALGIVGLVPDVEETIEIQLKRVLEQLEKKATNLDQFIFYLLIIVASQRYSDVKYIYIYINLYL